MNAYRRVGPIALTIPARRATRRTIRAAPWRSRRRPSLAVEIGPVARSPMARSTARARGDGYGLAALAEDGEGPMPASTPRASMSAPVASETRRPLSASSEIGACSTAGPSPPATSSAPTSSRSKPMALDSQSILGRADRGGRGVSDEAFFFGVTVEAGDHHLRPASGRADRIRADDEVVVLV
jgi:hypothetical protein